MATVLARPKINEPRGEMSRFEVNRVNSLKATVLGLSATDDRTNECRVHFCPIEHFWMYVPHVMHFGFVLHTISILRCRGRIRSEDD
ncbi:unnamed protein product [Darwinula stevensoni]|uniref:Uncharacterized protein n=1 Tax=Darwinula stevensoni TaxID=69355 RepID=A0A7R9AD59_9CRUS|nr:unnamed protein product [Darwinula stevensoni]CAG0900992.1 unnamed protein product [Darwinula stevensoni]